MKVLVMWQTEGTTELVVPDLQDVPMWIERYIFGVHPGADWDWKEVKENA